MEDMLMSHADTSSVLIVEDEADRADLYCNYLNNNFHVQKADTVDEALDIVDETIDVMLLDRKMAEMGGRDVLTKLRNRGYGMPVAMVTGVKPDVDIVDMPVDEYLVRPVDRETLQQTVRRLANRRSIEKKSQRLSRLAAKKTTVAANSMVDGKETTEYEEISGQMAALRAELDTTIDSLLNDGHGVVAQQELDQMDIQTLLDDIAGHSLPDTIEELIDEYQDVKYARPPFMWKWVHRLAPYNTLPSVDDEFRDKVPVDKTLLILFITLLDDVLEKGGDRSTFIELSQVPFEKHTESTPVDGVDQKYLTFGRRVWNTIEARIQKSPKYDVYDALFRYDIRQAINAIEYSKIAIQRPDLATTGDLERYESHNMAMFAYASIDLMHSSTDVRDEFNTLREVIWTAQLMARIGNWVSTWERELQEGDYSAGPIIYALENGVITQAELADIREGDIEHTDELVERIKDHGIEKKFLTRWENLYHRLQGYNAQFEKFDLEPFIEGTEEVLRYHLASTGLK